MPIHGPRCFKCSKPLSDREAEFCYDCASKKHSYDRGISIFLTAPFFHNPCIS
ncbi:MAG: hypothetical protein ACLRMZ_11175 [Blautia marasmi]